MINREQITLSKNKFEQSCRTKAQANNNLDNIYFSRTSMMKNIIINFTGLAGLIHVHAEHEASCFNKDLTRGR